MLFYRFSEDVDWLGWCFKWGPVYFARFHNPKYRKTNGGKQYRLDVGSRVWTF